MPDQKPDRAVMKLQRAYKAAKRAVKAVPVRPRAREVMRHERSPVVAELIAAAMRRGA